MPNSLCKSSNELIDVTGLCSSKDVREILSANPYWMQMYIPQTITIPEEKPDAKNIQSVNIGVETCYAKVIKTPISTITDSNGRVITDTNLESKKLTGRKLIIQGQVKQKVVYNADNDAESVHSAHFYIPFSAYMVIPKSIPESYFSGDENDTELIDSIDLTYQVSSCIEDLSITQIDPRTFLKHTTLLLYAVPTKTC